MIYGSSNHPVLVKKIKIRVWTLRDEIEAVLEQRKLKGYSDTLTAAENIHALHQEYVDTEQSKIAILGAEQTPEENTQEDDKDSGIAITQRRPVMPKDKMSDGVCFLSDIAMDSISLFTTKEFIEGQAIVIEFLIPNHFSSSAEVTRISTYNMHSRIISKQRPPYRLHAKFNFLKVGEKTLLRNFLQSIHTEIAESKKGDDAPNEDEEEKVSL